MATIKPFKGVLYNQEKIKDLSKVVAPPYDVISQEEQDLLYKTDAHNIIHILLGKSESGDNDKENKYTRAAKSLKDWEEDSILKRDEDEYIYVYLQEFKIDGKLKQRLGFISLLKLEEFNTASGSVYPHENTLDAPKVDRTKLISSIEANLGPIFALFADEDRSIDEILAKETKSKALIDIVDMHGIRNKLWRLTDKSSIEKITQLMRDKKLFIADGHHRYEVGLEFSRTKKEHKFGYILTYFTDVYAEGIVVLPVHRVVSGVGKDLSGLEELIAKHFSVHEITSKDEVKEFLSEGNSSEKKFVIYKDHRFTGLKVNDNDSLDVTILHKFLIEPLKKTIENENGEISIDFTKDIDYAVSKVDEGKGDLSILLNPTKVTQIRDTAFSGRRMPQKSTYFYPKVLTGLVVNVF